MSYILEFISHPECFIIFECLTELFVLSIHIQKVSDDFDTTCRNLSCDFALSKMAVEEKTENSLCKFILTSTNLAVDQGTGPTGAATLTHQASPQNPWNIQCVLPQLTLIRHLSVKSAYWISEAFQIQVILGEMRVNVRGPGKSAIHISKNTGNFGDDNSLPTSK